MTLTTSVISSAATAGPVSSIAVFTLAGGSTRSYASKEHNKIKHVEMNRL